MDLLMFFLAVDKWVCFNVKERKRKKLYIKKNHVIKIFSLPVGHLLSQSIAINFTIYLTSA